ncbi:MAG TPA: class I SAM-dependent methyltransferase [Actinomycetota bacterium]|nr:class I SAM-dependent methyltransferase [Actinomycetota bacterium]
MGGYAFGDGPAAARRLDLLADLFEPASRSFLERVAGWSGGHGRPGLAVDLGCGSGRTTRLVADVLEPDRTLGLDQSEFFVALAAGGPSGSPAVGFAVHDVTRVPFPCPPADVCYGRLLLSHLPDPGAVLAAWATQLAPGGLLLADEVERIHTDLPALRGYLEVAGALLATRGHTLEVGQVLARLPDPPGLVRRDDRIGHLAPPAPRAAAMFALNLAVWRGEAVRAGVATGDELDRLGAELAAVADGEAPGSIRWELRQLVLQRAERPACS